MKLAVTLPPLVLALMANSALSYADSSLASNKTLGVDRDYSGHRIGLGIDQGTEIQSTLHFTTIDDWHTQYPQTVDHNDPLNGFKIEYGYDFNRIISLNLGYSKLSHDVKGTHTIGLDHARYYREAKADIDVVNVEAELGYAFIAGSYDLKPYVALGVKHTTGSSSGYIDTGINHERYNHKLDDTASYMALGARLNTPIGLYLDTRLGTSWTLTMGYKF
ncbi:porin family protein [Vibrio sp. ZSDZ65]|uniref:Porin family protein n=1 Tax=Vibrio qingdaonensis TaxID=2829491 RepID=A0A9X3CQ55_9VIBR|nr:outer membrane beta-barrel protein [Vibrio qingdaonensis]MCW8347365.1 porin family protein [Vibrio qingdaonensis]